MWDETKDRPHLDASIQGYERGFYLRNDYYNGINLAYLLNLRASVSEPAEAIADYVQANRVRRQVVEIYNKLLLKPVDQVANVQDRYWIMATVAEAYIGLGDGEQADGWLAKAVALKVPDWMVEATAGQIGKLKPLIADSPLRYLAAA